MFDIDEHPNVAQAIDKAHANGIRLAVSNPCLELWFILHFEDQTAYLDRHTAQSKSADILSCGKNLTNDAATRLYEGFEDARERALLLDKKHDRDGSNPGANPSSNAWKLIDSILEVPAAAD